MEGMAPNNKWLRCGEGKKAKGRTDVRSRAKRRQHAAPMDDCRGARSGVPGGHDASCVSSAEVLPEYAGGAERGIPDERAAHIEPLGVHDGVDAGRDAATALTRQRTGTCPYNRKRARG